MKEKSLFLKFFIVLALFVIIPVILVSVIFSYQILNYSEGEISKSAIGKLKVARNLSELISDKLEKDALEISLGKEMDALGNLKLRKDFSGSPENIMNLYDVQLQLLNIIRSNSNIHSVYFYIEDSDFMITSNRGMSSLQLFADTGWYEEYERCNKEKQGSSWLPTRTIKYSQELSEGELGALNKVITYLYLLKPYTSRVKGVLIFNLYESALRNIINDESTASEGHIEIISREGNVISHIDEALVGANIKEQEYIWNILQYPEPEGYIIKTNQSRRELISFYKSDFNNWIYIGVFYVENLMEKVNRLRLYTIYISLLLVFAGVSISFFISRMLCNPLRKLIQDIKSRKGIDIKSGDTELTILSKAFDSLIQQRSKLSDMLEKSTESIKDAYMIDLIEGKTEKKPDHDTTGIFFPDEFFVCSVILIDNYKAFIDHYSAEQRKYIKMLIIKVGEELLNQQNTCAGIAYEKHKIVLVLNMKNPPGDLEDCLKQAFIKIQEEISKILDYSISLGVGNCVKGVQSVGESLDNALEALKLKILTGYGSIHFWNEPTEESQGYFYPYTQEKHIFNNIHAGTKEKMDESVNDFVDAVKANAFIRYDNVVLVFNQLIGNTMKVLLDMHCNISMVLGDDYNLYQELSSLETLDEIMEWLKHLYRVILQYFQKDRGEDKSPFEKALDYIHMNYRKDFEMSSIAEHIGLSYSHFRRIFKEHTGDNVIHYINSLRIDESKRMLCQTSLTVSEIALYLGYNSSQTFTRFFKMYEGITPGEFRVTQNGEM